MQSNAAKAGLAVALIVVAAVLFITLKGSDDKSSETDTVAGTTQSTSLQQTGEKDEVATQPKPAPKPSVPTVEIKGGQPVGGIKDLEFKSGDTIRFKVESDESGEIHFHGYDIGKDVEAGGSVSFAVPATIEGIFEVELEATAVQIAEVTVNP